MFEEVALSLAQERLWFLADFAPDSAEHNTAVGLRLSGVLDVAAVRRALAGLVARHGALRTTFHDVGGRGVQRVHAHGDYSFVLADLSWRPAAGRDRELDRVLRQQATTAFDLGRGPMLRVLLVRLAEPEHLLVLTIHHIVTDGWSMGVLLREFATLYGAALRGEPGQLAPLEVRYADFARWQREQLTGPVLAEHLGYWRTQLAGVPVLDLPTDRPRPPVRTPHSATHAVPLPADLVDQLTEVGHGRSATLFMVLVAATQVLLARHSGQRDVTVGTVVAGRPRRQLEGVVGFFVNTLPLRSQVEPRLPFTELLTEVAETLLQALTHQDVPFERLVDELALPRDPSRSPLVQAMVVLQSAPAGAVDLPGLVAERFEPPRFASGFDLVFQFWPEDDALTATIDYNTDLFHRATIERMAGHLRLLLDEIAADPRRPLRQLPMLDAAERGLVARWSGTGLGAGPSPRTVPALFAEQAAHHPAASAVVTADRVLSYAELDDRTNRLARLLALRGVGPERAVVVALPRQVELVVAALAVLKTGAAYLPVDPQLPPERLRFMLRDASPVLVVTSGQAGAGLPTDVPALVLDSVRTAAELERLPGSALTDEERTSRLLPAHPAYLIYTSGSTGTPKAVVVAHIGVPGLVAALRTQLGAGPPARVLQFSAPSFDAFFFELGLSLLSGGTLVVVPADQLLPGEPLTTTLRRYSVTHLLLPPSALAALPAGGLPDETTLVVGGEACPPGLVEAWSPGRLMVNAYGPTESTVCATMSGPLAPDEAVPIGHPIPGTRSYVMDGELRPAPIGAPGELYLAGPGLARGYLDRPELTAARFVADPFGEPGTRMYRTGDRARWLADGNLEFLGRLDDQVKVRGFRIELAEVEAALARHPAVDRAVASASADAAGRKRLVAHVVARAGQDLTGGELRRFLARIVPEYLVPSSFVVLDRLPMTASGKVDRRALALPSAGTDLPVRPARSPVEQALVEIWSQVLGTADIDIADNFFDLGGDSLLIMQVVSRARARGVHLTSRDVFTRPTLAELASVATTGKAATAPAASGGGRADGSAPLTPIQRWFFQNHPVHPERFTQSVTVELSQPVDESALRVALRAVVTHHEALRLRLECSGGRWRPYLAGAELPVRRFDLSRLSAADQDGAVAQATESLWATDLPGAPLVAAALIVLGPRRPPRLHLAIHHLVVDTVSWRILLADLRTAYRLARNGSPVRLEPVTTSFQEWATRLAEHAAGGGFDDELGYWFAAVADENTAAGTHDNATAAPGLATANTVACARDVLVRLELDETDRLLHRVPAAYRTQINDILLSALGHTVARWTGQRRVLVDIEGHGREEIFPGVDLSRTVGWFTTMFPVSLAVPDGDSWRELVISVKEQLRTVPHHGIGYGVLRYLRRPDEGSGAPAEPVPAPLISFNYLGQWEPEPDSGELFLAASAGPVTSRHPCHQRPHELELVGAVRHGRLELTLTYSADRHDEATVCQLAEQLRATLRRIIEHCAAPDAGGCSPSDFPLAGLDQPAVDRVAGNGRGIEDIYPLTPTQSGMLFHTLLDPESSVYVERATVTIDGVSRPDLLAQAWQLVVDRTPTLRTSVVWDGLDQPVQVVHRTVRLPITCQDQCDPLPIDLTRPPPMRVAIAPVSATTVRVTWTFHHLLLDGWSTYQVLSDVLAHYRVLAGQTELTAPARRPFRHYLEWLARQDHQAAAQYWQAALTGVAPATFLPYDRRGTDRLGTRARARAELDLSGEESTRLYALARDSRLTVNTVVQGAWALLLSRCSGRSEVVFGATVAGRPGDIAAVESIIGMFVNTLPVRVTVDPECRVLPWLRGIQGSQLEAQPFQFAALAQVRAASGLPPDADLFDSIVVFENYPVAEGTAGGPTIRDLDAVEVTNYPLNLVCYPGRTLSFRLIFDPDLFEPATVERLAGHLRLLLAGIAAGPDRRLAELPYPEPPAVVRASGPATAVPGGRSAATAVPGGDLAEAFQSQARRTPDRVALVAGETTVSYAELNARANRLAHRLTRLGAGPGTLVAVLLPCSVELVLATVAVTKTGGAYLPLDNREPPARLRSIVADARASVLVTGGTCEPPELDPPIPVLALGTGASTPDGPQTDPELPGHPDQLAYVMYTSGSTGRPKGVAVTHRNVLALAADRCWQGGGHERVLLHSPYAFDASTYELWVPLLSGGEVVVAPGSELDLHSLAETLVAGRVTGLFLTAGLFELLATQAPGALATVREVWTGGDVVSAVAVRAVLEHCPNIAVVNGYGPTETTTFATCHRMSPADDLGPVVPIGRPLDATRAYLLDARLRPVPAGVAGELYLGGAGVARGYAGRPSLTAERFVPDLFGGSGARMYRTGDVARLRPDGRLDFLGRADSQVKIRGFRVEPGEISAALCRHPDVAQAAAVVHETHRPGRKRLVAYAVPQGSARPDAGQLREYLAERLPEYLVPAVVVLLDRLPLTPNGKIDHRALAAPEGCAGRAGTEAAPRSPAEQALARIWAEVLGLDQVGVEDDFFALGGDSILGIKAISRVRDVLGIALSPRALFDHPTVAALAALVPPGTVAGRSDRIGLQDRIDVVARDAALPQSFAQQRLWFLHHFAPHSAEYNSSVALRFTGALDTSVLGAALSSLVARHEPLRTTFDSAPAPQVPVQRVHPPYEVSLPLIDLSGLGEPARDAELHRRLSAATTAPFDLRHGPLLRVLLVRLAEREHALLLVMHHAVTDGWSMGLLAEELAACYAAGGTAEGLAPLPVQYADFAAWQRRRLTGPALAGSLAYWRSQLAGVEPLPLPTDRPRPAVKTSAGATHELVIGADVLAGLRQLGQDRDATLFMVLVATTQALLARYSGSTDIAVGTVTAGRNRTELERLVGFFVNTVVLRSRVDDRTPFVDFLAQVRLTVLAAFAHQQVPFEHVIEALQPQRDASRTPLVQVMVVLQNIPRRSMELPGLSIEEIAAPNPSAQFDLTLELSERPAGLAVAITYNTDLFEAATIERFGRDLCALATVVVANPRQELWRLFTRSEPEHPRQAVPGGEPRYPADATMTSLLSDRVARHPHRPAVRAGGQAVTYRELDDRADAIAARLATLGVRRGDRVCTVVDPGVDAVASVVALAKLGAAYLSIEPDIPPKRLRSILAESRPAALLTTRETRPATPESVRTVYLEDLDADGRPSATPGPGPMDPLCCVYTSGSTGRPKGVVLTHRNLVNLIFWHRLAFNPAGTDRIGQVASLTFDASVWEIWAALCHGACLCVAGPDIRRDERALTRWIIDEGITFCFLTTAMGERLVEGGALDASRLRHIVLGGDKLTKLPTDETPYALVNGYGPTEASVFASWFDTTGWRGTERGRLAPPPIGHPIQGMAAYLLDRHLQPVPAECTGELYLAGDGLAQGYLNQPGLTAERFVANPFATTPGARMYRTGDLARRTADGLIEFHGRNDRQVKVRGVRVELDEIEWVLARQRNVAEAATIAVPAGGGEPAILAYLTPVDGTELDVGELRTTLRRHLPEAMLPTEVTVLDQLPRTRTGKIDRRALAAAHADREPAAAPPPAGAGQPPAPPRTDTERIVARHWAEVLRRQSFGVQEKFFDVGGSSLTLLDLRNRLEPLCGSELPIAQLFAHPTIEAMAHLVDRQRNLTEGHYEL